MKVNFSAEVEVPDGTPLEDVKAWLRFELGETGDLLNENPMSRWTLPTVGCRGLTLQEWREGLF